jgi:hypothetical protein
VRREEAPPCDKVPDFGRIRSEPNPTQLRAEELDAFFFRFRFF